MKFKEYKPFYLMRNGHINTIYPTLFRKLIIPNFQRVRVNTADDDFLDVDFINKGNRRIAILCHGLEGSSQSQYIIGTTQILSESKWDVAAINYRGCSGVMNNNLRMYHSGATDDLDRVVNFVLEDYDEIALVGFSLGGNLCLKYVGERESQVNDKINKVMAISVPVNLGAGSKCIGAPSNFIYEYKFMVSLKEKIKQKKNQFPDQIDLHKILELKKLYDFDNLVTGPINGFKDADDYYQKCSSKQFITSIRKSTLIVNALDDPFLPLECYPFEEVKGNPSVNMLTPKYGGHVGFTTLGKKHFWIEEVIQEFLETRN